MKYSLLSKIPLLFLLFFILPFLTEAETLVDPYGYVYSLNKRTDQEERLSNVRVSLYSLEANGDWQKWDGTKYYQDNPVFTISNGQYSFSVPPGKYYLTAYKQDYQLFRSKKFETSAANPFNLDIEMRLTAIAEIQNAKNLFSNLGIKTQTPYSILYLALAAIVILGIPLISWLVWRVYKESKRYKRTFNQGFQ